LDHGRIDEQILQDPPGEQKADPESFLETM
jgi:hypothetical protein